MKVTWTEVWSAKKGDNADSACDVGTGVLYFSSNGASTTFIPGVMLVGKEIMTRDHDSPSDVPGCTLNDRVTALLAELKLLKASYTMELQTAETRLLEQKNAYAKNAAIAHKTIDDYDKENLKLSAEISRLKAERAASGLSMVESEGGFLSLFKRGSK